MTISIWGPVMGRRKTKRSPAITTILIILGGVVSLLFSGCEKAPTAEGVYIMHQNRYTALKSFPLAIEIENVKQGFIRTYILDDETLAEAETYHGRRHQFLIRSPYEKFKIVQVNQQAIIKYKYISFKPYVYFSEVEASSTTEISITGDHLAIEAQMGPGRYLLIPWREYSPIEPIGYGFIIQ